MHAHLLAFKRGVGEWVKVRYSSYDIFSPVLEENQSTFHFGRKIRSVSMKVGCKSQHSLWYRTVRHPDPSSALVRPPFELVSKEVLLLRTGGNLQLISRNTVQATR